MGSNRKCLVSIPFPMPIVQILFCSVATIFISSCSSLAQEVIEQHQISLKTFIVHVNKPNNEPTLQSENLRGWHESFVPLTAASETKRPRMVYSYRNVGAAFAAKLTPEEAGEMESKDGVLLVREEKMLSLHTTRSPQFLGLNRKVRFWKESNFGEGVIVGVLDTGIWPYHPSFSDEGMPPPPAKWKGKWEFRKKLCNNKIIGARNLVSSSQVGHSEPPFDEVGHGTHTAGTIAGNFVKGANLFGNIANGTAAGIAPHAHLAIYKVCNPNGCAENSILAAFDAAIEDGVDVLSLSLGGGSSAFFMDAIAVGSFAAIQNGILVSTSAGNGGPLYWSLTNEAPWLLTVGASSIDRRLLAIVKLGNGEEYEGESSFQPEDFSSSLLPLIHLGGMNPCTPGVLKRVNVKGKIVLCVASPNISRIAQGEAVKNASGAAMILMNKQVSGYTTVADPYDLPATHVSYFAGIKIKSYIDSNPQPKASLFFKGTVVGDRSAPTVASFSSRGPTVISTGIMKPDVIGPGVNILAAWPFLLGGNHHTVPRFNLMSGTSMSCPHLSGVAALIKSSHPDWSRGAIKSALMTTVNHKGFLIADEKLLPAKTLATGAGHVNPSKANEPGLVYDMKPSDYIPYFCGLNYTDREIGVILQRKVSCVGEKRVQGTEQNYPSFSVKLGSNPQSYNRRVTNVGQANSSYVVEVYPPKGVRAKVIPIKFAFSRLKQSAKYCVTFSRTGSGQSPHGTYGEGYLKWVSHKHTVISPISVSFI